jgi:hypothetical protein
MHRVIKQIKLVCSSLGDVRYPFDHARGDISLSDFALDRSLDPDDLGGIYEAGDEVLDKLPMLYVRMLGALVYAAEQVECALGLPALPEPEPPPEAADA